jgi:hypothetical protein
MSNAALDAARQAALDEARRSERRALADSFQRVLTGLQFGQRE